MEDGNNQRSCSSGSNVDEDEKKSTVTVYLKNPKSDLEMSEVSNLIESDANQSPSPARKDSSSSSSSSGSSSSGGDAGNANKDNKNQKLI